MGFLSYLKYSVWDYLLCTCAASALCYVCLIAFKATSPLQSQPWIAIGVCALIMLVLFMVAYRFITAVVGSIALVVAFCVAIIVAWRVSGAASPFADGEGNYAYAVALLTVCSVAVFLLSRRKATTVVLLGGGLIMCAAMEYLYWQGLVPGFIIFGVSVAALVAYRNYQRGLAGSATEKISFGSATVAGLVIAALGAGLACGLFALVIAPLNPPNVVVKLITTHVRAEEEHLKGAGDSLSVQNKNLFSMNTQGEQQVFMNSNGTMQQQQNMDDSNQSNDQQTIAIAGNALNLDNTDDQKATAISLKVPDWFFLVLAISLLVLIIAIIVLRKLLRARWLARVRKKPAAAQIKALFIYFLQGFAKMKMPRPTNQTLREYAVSVEGLTTNFEQTTANPDFNGLAATYAAVVYGGYEPAEEDLKSFYDYYGCFHKRAVKYVKRFKYLILFFRI